MMTLDKKTVDMVSEILEADRFKQSVTGFIREQWKSNFERKRLPSCREELLNRYDIATGSELDIAIAILDEYFKLKTKH